MSRVIDSFRDSSSSLNPYHDLRAPEEAEDDRAHLTHDRGNERFRLENAFGDQERAQALSRRDQLRNAAEILEGNLPVAQEVLAEAVIVGRRVGEDDLAVLHVDRLVALGIRERKATGSSRAADGQSRRSGRSYGSFQQFNTPSRGIGFLAGIQSFLIALGPAESRQGNGPEGEKTE